MYAVASRLSSTSELHKLADEDVQASCEADLQMSDSCIKVCKLPQTYVRVLHPEDNRRV